jgi:hypothetical protein
VIEAVKSCPPSKRSLADLYLSPEALEDIRRWQITEVSLELRRTIYMMEGPV